MVDKMKTGLRCKLFGHKFMISQSYIREEDGERMTRYLPVDYCHKCGLSKEEIASAEHR